MSSKSELDGLFVTISIHCRYRQASLRLTRKSSRIHWRDSFPDTCSFAKLICQTSLGKQFMAVRNIGARQTKDDHLDDHMDENVHHFGFECTLYIFLTLFL